MKMLSEFITEQQALLQQHGDLPVIMEDDSEPTIERFEEDDFDGFVIA
jgi:hypothetical protein